jgi:hypothetical protein
MFVVLSAGNDACDTKNYSPKNIPESFVSPFPAKFTSERIEARLPNSAATFGLLIFKPESKQQLKKLIMQVCLLLFQPAMTLVIRKIIHQQIFRV